MKNLLLLLLLVLCGCGANPAPTPDPIPGPEVDDEKVIVALFGAPWCPYCKSSIPQTQSELRRLPLSVREKIQLKLYVPTGASSSTQPTQEGADAYKNSLGLSDAVAIPDPRWGAYKKWIGGGLSLPAGVVLSPGETVIRSFRAGSQFDPGEIAETAARAAQ